MPIIDITCKEYYFPGGDASDALAVILVERLGRNLPDLCIANSKKLGLGDDAPVEAVQVNYHLFHYLAENAPDICLKFQFSEPYPGEESATESVACLKHLVIEKLRDKDVLRPSFAIECFWGPSHGHLRYGSVVSDW